ncbi:MAG: NADH-quinone oxidoreductase subunit C [Nitrospirota bacterium]
MAIVMAKLSESAIKKDPAQIAEKIKEKFPEDVVEITNFRDQGSVIVKKDRIVNICRYLHDEADLRFDLLKDLCGVDYKGKKEPRFEVVYTLYSIRHRHMIRLRAQVHENDPKINSVTPVWIGADWHERECFDMFGIIFSGHPDLRRILLPEDWEGYPLRKDYPLAGPEKEWQGFVEVLEKAKELKEFDWEG